MFVYTYMCIYIYIYIYIYCARAYHAPQEARTHPPAQVRKRNCVRNLLRPRENMVGVNMVLA